MSFRGDVCTGDMDEERIDRGRIAGARDFQDEAEAAPDLKIIRAERLQGNRRAGAGISVPSGKSSLINKIITTTTATMF